MLVLLVALNACAVNRRTIAAREVLLSAACYPTGSAREWKLRIATTGHYTIERATSPGWEVAHSGDLSRAELETLRVTVAGTGYCGIGFLENRSSCDDVSQYALAVRCGEALVAVDFDQCLHPSPQTTILQRMFATLRGIVPRVAGPRDCAFGPP